jgi:CRISPR-associated protein Csh1
MDFVKVKRLSNEILNKLRQEKILRYTEAIFSAHKMLMGLNEKNWKYNKDENLYYILSGYAYETMKKKEEKKDE